MTAGPAVVSVQPAEHALATALLPHAVTAADHLGLGTWFRCVTLILDDLAADERPWHAVNQAAAGRELALYLHPDAVLKDRPGSTSLPAPEQAWTLQAMLRREPEIEPGDFAPAKAQRLLHHEFLWARDLSDGTLDPAAVPPSLAEAFQEAWAATVDGRLRRAGLAGLGEGERRIRFLRLFATSGVVTPAHWQVFHSLWGGEAATTAAVLRLVKRLPPLRRASRDGE
jgi:hypothetical protein